MKKVEIYENYAENPNVIIFFNDYLRKVWRIPNNSVCRAVEEAINLMDEYNFSFADIISEETGELFASITIDNN